MSSTLDLDGGSSLEVVADVLGVAVVEPLELLVEVLVALVDVVDVRVGVVHAPPAELLPLLNLKWNVMKYLSQMHCSFHHPWIMILVLSQVM